MGIRAAAAVALGRAARWGGETFMHRSAGNIPGAMALRVDPMVLVDLAKKVNSVAVISGTTAKPPPRTSLPIACKLRACRCIAIARETTCSRAS